jgi:fibronectin type 3 domain-containing protein
MGLIKILKMKTKIYLHAVLLLFLANVPAKAQSNQNALPSPVISGPDGNYVFLYNEKNTSNQNIKTIGHNIYRAAAGSSNFAQIASLKPISTIAELNSKVNPSKLQELKNIAKANTDQELLNFMQRAGVKDFGMASLDLDFLQAAGLLYVDKLATKNLNFQYRVAPIGGTEGINYTQHVYDPTALVGIVPKFYTKSLFATDSVTRMRWAAPAPANSFIYFGKIYRQEGLKGAYTLQQNRSVALFQNEKRDSLHYFLEDPSVRPERYYRYFVAVTDFVGNEIGRSDTASLITVAYNQIQNIHNLSVKDSLDGLHLQWDKLPSKLYYTGIEVSRSRDVRERFVVIDTLAAPATSYFDARMLPNVNYYYQLRPLLAPLNGWEPLPSTTGNYFFESKNRQPLPIYGLKAQHHTSGILLNWQHSADIDLFAYYVMRNSSEKGIWEVVSPALKDSTYLDSTATLNGRVQYLYAIKAVNNFSKESTLIEQVSIRPQLYENIHGVTGITGYADTGKFYLTWDDASKLEPGLVGYLLYKRPATSKPLLEPDRPAIYTIQKNGFVLAYPGVITSTSFVDDTASPGQEIEYTVVAVDAFQMMSPLSPFFKIQMPKKTIQAPAQLYVRNTSKGLEVAWPKTNQAMLSGVNIYRRGISEKIFVKISTSKPSDTAFVDTSVRAKNQYVYAISYQSPDGESPKSIEKSIVKN